MARRYAVNANLVFKWLKDPRFAPEADAFDQEATFLPVEIEADVAVKPEPIDVPIPSLSAPLSASRVDITLSDGWRILVEGSTELTAVVSLVQVLSVWSRFPPTHESGWRLCPVGGEFALLSHPPSIECSPHGPEAGFAMPTFDTPKAPPGGRASVFPSTALNPTFLLGN